jgi:hypothetical protein
LFDRAGTGSRLALFMLLAVLVAVGLQGRAPAPVWDSQSQAHDAEVVGALGAIGLVLLLALAVRSRRAPADQLLATRLRVALWYVLGAGEVALAVMFVLLVANIRLVPARPGRVTGARPTAPLGHLLRPPGASPAGSHLPLSGILYGLAAALVLAAILAVALRVMRHAPRPSGPELRPPAQEYSGEMQEALLWGQRALLEMDDARAAIIACYLAMEESLARAGTARASAETPDELLGRAARTLLISGGAAAQLTSLFYEARFSSHPLGDAQKGLAQQALAELVAALDHPRAVAAGAAP